jgi:hypothetical protein
MTCSSHMISMAQNLQYACPFVQTITGVIGQFQHMFALLSD